MNKVRKIIWVLVLIIAFLVFLIGVSLFHMFGVKHIDGNEVVLTMYKNFSLDDYDMNLRLENIYDSRCPKDAQCVWAGELSYNINIRYDNEKANYKLSTVNNKQLTLNNGRTLEIIDYDEHSVTLKIS